jgi:5-methylthioadenosine/S-adenosylhomocysteine deaminase
MGTDGAQSNNTLDLLQDLKTGVLIQKQRERDAAFLPVAEAIRLVTMSGATALGLQTKIGSLETGKDADLFAIDLNAPHLQPLFAMCADSLYTALVYCASGKDVTDTMVAGRWLMRDRHIVTLDTAAILAHTNALSRSIRVQAGLL